MFDGYTIKSVRESKGIKQKDFAKMLNIPISTLANYENGHREPTFDTLDQIANVLGVAVSDLLNSAPRSLGKRIAIARKQKGLTQIQLANTIGKTESSIRKYEADLITDIPSAVKKDLSNVLGINLCEDLSKIDPINQKDINVIDYSQLTINQLTAIITNATNELVKRAGGID